jgi:hypothetical protein
VSRGGSFHGVSAAARVPHGGGAGFHQLGHASSFGRFNRGGAGFANRSGFGRFDRFDNRGRFGRVDRFEDRSRFRRFDRFENRFAFGRFRSRFYYPWYYGYDYPAYYGFYGSPYYTYLNPLYANFDSGYGAYAPYLYAQPAYDDAPADNADPTGDELYSTPAPSVRPARPERIAPPDANGNGTYPYDGGPQDPVPMPKADPEPTSKPPAAAPATGRVVSLKASPSKFAYPAYGEQAGPTAFAQDRVVETRALSARKPAR